MTAMGTRQREGGAVLVEALAAVTLTAMAAMTVAAAAATSLRAVRRAEATGRAVAFAAGELDAAASVRPPTAGAARRLEPRLGRAAAVETSVAVAGDGTATFQVRVSGVADAAPVALTTRVAWSP